MEYTPSPLMAIPKKVSGDSKVTRKEPIKYCLASGTTSLDPAVMQLELKPLNKSLIR